MGQQLCSKLSEKQSVKIVPQVPVSDWLSNYDLICVYEKNNYIDICKKKVLVEVCISDSET